MKITFLGLSITSSWGNGHATTFRGLVRELHSRGHQVVFLEREQPWYAENRDLRNCPQADIILYHDLAELESQHRHLVADADCVVLGSFVPEGIAIADWIFLTATDVVAFYDIDTPVTLDQIAQHTCSYLAPQSIPRFDLYLSFTGGPILHRLRSEYGARRAEPLYCAVDPHEYCPQPGPQRWDLGYLGTYSADRQPGLQELLLNVAHQDPATRMVVAGPMYPATTNWPSNVERMEHLPPQEHSRFYSRQRYTLNLTREAMKRAGFSPSIRLFEAASAGTPIISDQWDGIETFFVPGREILLAANADEVARHLHDVSERTRMAIGGAARERVLREHTSRHRAHQLEQLIYDTRLSRRSNAFAL